MTGGPPPVLGAPIGPIALLVMGATEATPSVVRSLGSAGCDVMALAILENGRWLILVPGAPAQVNAAFPSQLLERTPFFVRCAA